MIRWSSVAGRQYTLYRATNLVSGFNITGQHIPATPIVNTYTDTSATASGPYYYRVKVE